MKRFAIILFLLLSISFVAVHIVLPQADANQELVEDDSHAKGAEKETETNKQKEAKEKLDELSYNQFSLFILGHPLSSSFYCSPLMAGYCSRPFTPPDLV
jgi:Ni/Co efflux regulator RcnB